LAAKAENIKKEDVLMKNLKKALVLVLAFAMVFSLFTFNASAASFSDDEDIVNKEAVETMVQLGIINGNPDGTFAPKRIVTRAEMCKMICVAMSGGNTPLLDSTSLFSDTKGHWANSYINYCYNKGIVSGDSGKGGTFRPDAPVTGIEAAKMMLVAIGYNSTLAGFTGPEWAINVASAASDKNLFNSIGTLNVSAGLSRDNAAQLIYNGIRADMVEYTSTLTTDPNGQLTSTPTLKNRPGVTMLTDRFGVSVLEGYIVSSEYATINIADNTNVAGETTMFVKTKGAESVNEIYTLKTSTPADMVGKTVRVYVKDSSLTGKTYNTVFGTPVVTSTNRVKTFTGDAYAKSSDLMTALKTVGINGFTPSATAPADGVVIAYNNGHTIDRKYYNSATSLDDVEANKLLGRGKEVTFIDNDNDGLVDIVKIMAKHVGEVTVLNSAGNSGKGSITVTPKNGSLATTHPLSSKTYDVVYGEEDVALKDYVLYYELNGKYYVEKASSETVEVSKITPNASKPENGTVTAGSVVYRQSALVKNINGSKVLAEGVDLGKTATFYFDNYGNVIYAKAATAAAKYAIVTAVGTYDPLNGLSVRIVKEDGTSEVVKLASVTDTKGVKTTAGDMVNALNNTAESKADTHIFSYTVKSNGDYELTALATDTNTTEIKTNNPKLEGSNLIANSNTIFVVKTGATTYSTYTGIANVPSVSGGSFKALAYVKNNAVAIAFVKDGTVSTTGASGVFICSTVYSKVLDGTTPVYEYPAIVDGVATTVTATDSNVFGAVGYYNSGIKVNAKGYYTAAGATPGTPDKTGLTLIRVGNGIISDTAKDYTYDDNTKVFEISATGAVTESAIGNLSDGTNDLNAQVAIIVPKGNAAPNDTVAKYVFVVGDAAARPVSVTLGLGTGSDLVLGNTDLTSKVAGTVTGFDVATNKVITITVANAAGTTSTVKINGTDYTSGADYTVTAKGTYTVEVTTVKAGVPNGVYNYTFIVS